MQEKVFVTFPVLFAFAIPHTFFAMLFLLSKENRKYYDIIASCWILLLAMPILQRFLIIQTDSFHLGIYFQSIVYPMSYGPLGYLYTKSLVDNTNTFKTKDLLHFIPLVVLYIILVFLPEDLHPNNRPPMHLPPPGNPPPFKPFALVIDGLILVSIFSYSCFIIKKIKKHTKMIEDYFSSINMNRNLAWIKWVVASFIFFFGWNSISPLLFKYLMNKPGKHFLLPHEFKLVHLATYILFSYILSFFTIRQSIIYPSQASPEQTEIKETSKEEKYTRSGLKEDQSKKIAEKLIQYMETEKPYLKEDLRIRDVADALQVNINHLSQSLNEIIQKNFYQFVNEYRVKEIQDRLKDPKYQEYPLLRIAYECGFNSKSSFNSTFRRLTQISPKEFRNQILSSEQIQNF